MGPQSAGSQPGPACYDKGGTEPTVTDADRRLLGRSVIQRVVAQHAEQLQSSGRELWDRATEQTYSAAVEDAVFGYGRWQPLFQIPEAENIEITGWDSVQIQYGDGTRRAHPPVADSDEELVEAVRYLGETSRPSRPFDDAHPTMTSARSTAYQAATANSSRASARSR